MKRIILTSVAVIALIMLTNAQSSKQFGIKAGVNFATLSGSDADDFKSLIGFHFGVLSEFGLSEKVTFQPEFLYSAQGGKIKESFEGESAEVKFTANYLNLPLMIKYYATDHFFIEAGPQIGYLLSAKLKGEATFEGETEAQDEDSKDLYNDFDFGFDFGAGYKLNSGLSINARYYLGLSKVFDKDEFDEDLKVYNSVFQISVAYSL